MVLPDAARRGALVRSSPCPRSAGATDRPHGSRPARSKPSTCPGRWRGSERTWRRQSARSTPSGNRLDVLEHVGREMKAQRQEALGTLRTDACRPEESADLPVSVESLALEEKDVLHRDDRLLHAGDLG